MTRLARVVAVGVPHHITQRGDLPQSAHVCSGFAPLRSSKVLVFIMLLQMFMGTACVCAYSQAANPAKKSADIGQVAHALCGKRVALLGETPMHGFGKTLEFKVELVRRLVEKCHYSALFIESGTYDYINIEKKLKSGQDVMETMISAAIGGLWANQEVQALIPFLREKVKAGSLTLGGLDDQIGRGSYAQLEMPFDLVQHLEGEERSRCLAILNKHMLWQYSNDAPYSPSDKTKIVGCLSEIESRISQPGEGNKRWQEDKAMIASLKRNFARDFVEDDFTKSDQELKWINDRDRSMYMNFQWLLSRLPGNSKIIVWAATVHVARELNGIDGFEGRVPLGSYIRRDFGDRAFSLGFSASSGSYAMGRMPVKQLSAAPDSSLEAQALAHHGFDTVYLSRKQLQKCGPVAARPLGTSFKTAKWNQVFDGLVIFREERPPQNLSH